MHRLWSNQVSPLVGNDVTVLSPKRGAASDSPSLIWRGDPDFEIVINCDHTSIMHRLLFNQVLQLSGNDVIVLYPLGGAASDFLLWNWEG